MTFRVLTKGYSQCFDRWIDALSAANALKPQCKSLLQDIRIFEEDELIWLYSRSHRYPMYIGAGTYDRLVRRFVEESTASDTPAPAATLEPAAERALEPSAEAVSEAATADAEASVEDGHLS